MCFRFYWYLFWELYLQLFLSKVNIGKSMVVSSFVGLIWVFSFFLSFFLLFVWANLATRIFPRTQNGSTVVEVATSLTGISYFITRVLYGSLIAPVAEEIVCRGFLMTSLSKFKNYYIDVLVSAAIFGAMHVLQHGWITTDFILYFVMGLIFCMMFRCTRSIYWTIALHASWNTFLLIVSLLVFGF